MVTYMLIAAWKFADGALRPGVGEPESGSAR